MEMKASDGIVKKVLYILLAGSLYSFHFFMWFCTFFAAQTEIVFPVQRYDMDQEFPWFAVGFILQLISSVFLLILIACTRKKPRLWLRLILVAGPVLHTFLYRAYLIGKYGHVDCGKLTLFEFISGYCDMTYDYRLL
jgi:hypothetical protein